jgi:hypothetical protein
MYIAKRAKNSCWKKLRSVSQASRKKLRITHYALRIIYYLCTRGTEEVDMG